MQKENAETIEEFLAYGVLKPSAFVIPRARAGMYDLCAKEALASSDLDKDSQFKESLMSIPQTNHALRTNIETYLRNQNSQTALLTDFWTQVGCYSQFSEEPTHLSLAGDVSRYEIVFRRIIL